MKGNKVIVITGANSGIGKETAKQLALENNIIVLVCRDKKRGEEAKKEIIEHSGNPHVFLMLCDLGSFSDINRFCIEFLNQFRSLDILINNAGTMSFEREITPDGFEKHFQVNYLGPFLLTTLLSNSIKPNGRIINVSSLAHKFGKINFDDINLTSQFSMLKAYSQSKLALVLFTYKLAAILKEQKITVNCLHPGIIVSNLGVYKERRVINFLTKKLSWIFSSAKKGSRTTVFLATSDKVKNITAGYFSNSKAKKSAKITYNKNLADKLWSYSIDQVKEWLK